MGRVVREGGESEGEDGETYEEGRRCSMIASLRGWRRSRVGGSRFGLRVALEIQGCWRKRIAEKEDCRRKKGAGQQRVLEKKACR